MSGPRVESERTARLSAVFQRIGAKIIYTYDLGDSWEHSILLEKRLSPEPLTTYPICTDGQFPCPPEDCGGIPGYYDPLDALADSSHPRHEELRDWIGDDFNPEAFSVEKVNRIFSPARRRNKSSAH
jgi:Plasmid pRiA4b ORF-3-like protein